MSVSSQGFRRQDADVRLMMQDTSFEKKVMDAGLGISGCAVRVGSSLMPGLGG